MRTLSNQRAAVRGARLSAFDELPVLDMTPMFSPDVTTRRVFAGTLADTCANVGFFYLAGHRVPRRLVDRAFAVGKRFFALPEADKMTTHTSLNPTRYGGYTPLRERGGTRHACFDVGVEYGSDEPEVTAGLIPACRNVWPTALPEFEAVMTEYKAAVVEVGRHLFRAFALALDLPEDYFDPKISKPFGGLRVNHYPPQDSATAEADLGISAHTDFQCLTLLMQDEHEGLQVRNGAGDWITAPPIGGTYVVNIGDMMARWTNDIFSSTLHRVINVSGAERMSIPYFYGTNFGEIIDTLPSCITPDRPKRYEPIIAGRHVLDRFMHVYSNAPSSMPACTTLPEEDPQQGTHRLGSNKNCRKI